MRRYSSPPVAFGVAICLPRALVAAPAVSVVLVHFAGQPYASFRNIDELREGVR